MATVARAAAPLTVAGIPATARLHVVTGKGGTGKTTVAAALAMALSVGGRRALVVEVEGRQGLAQLFDVPALSYNECRLATTEGGGEVLGLSVDAEQALLEYLDMFYSLKRSARALRRMGAIDFVTTLAPGLRDILITGKLKEAVVRTRDGWPQYDAVVLDAPPTGRIRLFLDSTKEVVKLTKFGPIHRQSTGVIQLLHSAQTAVHIVTLLEEMPVQETIDAAQDLAAADYPLGAVIVNRMRPALVKREQVDRRRQRRRRIAARRPQDGERSHRMDRPPRASDERIRRPATRAGRHCGSAGLDHGTANRAARSDAAGRTGRAHGARELFPGERRPVTSRAPAPARALDMDSLVLDRATRMNLDVFNGTGLFLNWGPPLLLVAVTALLWQLYRLGRVPARVWTLLTIPLAFWILTAVGRAYISVGSLVLTSTGYESRYLYVGAVFLILLGSEVARGHSASLPVRLVAGVLVIAAVVSNLGPLRQATTLLRTQAQMTQAELGTLNLSRPVVKPNYVSNGFIFGTVTAAEWFAAEKQLGSGPAATPAQITALPSFAQEAADLQLIKIQQLQLRGVTTPPALGTAPRLDGYQSGTVSVTSACVHYRPAPFTPASATNGLEVVVPASGLLLGAGGAPATVGVRRFSSHFSSLGTLSARARATLRVAPDLAPEVWHVQMTGGGPLTACGLA